MTVFCADLVVAAVMFLILELLILRDRYWIFSPSTLFVASFLLLYAFPFFTHEHVAPWPRLDKLTFHEIQGIVRALRWFFYTWCCAMTLSLWVMSRWPVQALRENDVKVHQKVLVGAFALFCLVYLLYLGSGVGFSPVAIVDRMIHPRSYTYLKEGLGPILTLKNGLNRTLLFVSMIAVVHRPRILLYKAVLALTLMMTVLGGSKASMLFPLLFYVLILQKLRLQKGAALSAKLGYGVASIISAVVLLFGAFWFYRQTVDEAQSFDETAESMKDYVQEAYMSARIIADYDAEWEYAHVAIVDTLSAPIPRALWVDKPYVGFYRRYWQPRYQPGTPSYHTTTCGSLAEAHMVLGTWGPAVYGLLFAALVSILQGVAIRARTAFMFLFALYIDFFIFYLVRVGFVGTTPSAIILFLAIAYVLLFFLIPMRSGRYRPRDYRLSHPAGWMPK